ncbi:MAG TPA: hypothetical protein VIH52_01560 [Candidatus Nanoarchaeia archaeon]
MDEKDLKAIQGLFRKELKTELKKELEPIKADIGVVKGSVMNLEKEIGVYMDALDIERKRINTHDGRLEVIEESLGLEKVQ